MPYRFCLRRKTEGAPTLMNTFSHKSIENNIKKSTPEAITSRDSEASLSKKGKTPLAKQAKRDKKSSELWRSKTIQKSAKIVAQTRTIAEIRKSREYYKEQNKDLVVQFEKLTFDLKQSKKKL